MSHAKGLAYALSQCLRVRFRRRARPWRAQQGNWQQDSFLGLGNTLCRLQAEGLPWPRFREGNRLSFTATPKGLEAPIDTARALLANAKAEATCRWAAPRRTPRALPRGYPARHPAVRLLINEIKEPLHGWLRTVPPCGVACSYAGPVAAVCQSLQDAWRLSGA